LRRYPKPGPNSKFKDEKERFIQYMQFQFFTCHVRTITSAYKDKSWVAQYSRGTGKHGMDMQADFYNSGGSPPKGDPGFAQFAPTYQDYLLSHARTGNPNTLGKKSAAILWPKVKFGDTFGDVLEAGKNGFWIIEDQLTKAQDCDVWTDILAGITKAGGRFPFPLSS
jgi:carboxylesterase type B